MAGNRPALYFSLPMRPLLPVLVPVFALVVVLGFIAGCQKPTAPAGADGDAGLRPGAKLEREDAHLLVVFDVSRTVFSLVEAGLVSEPLPSRKLDLEQLPWRLELTDDGGKLLFVLPLPTPAVQRGEYRPDAGRAHALRIHTTETTFPARLPLVEGAAKVKLLSRAHALPETDARREGKPPNAWVELGQARLEVTAR